MTIPIGWLHIEYQGTSMGRSLIQIQLWTSRMYLASLCCDCIRSLNACLCSRNPMLSVLGSIFLSENITTAVQIKVMQFCSRKRRESTTWYGVRTLYSNSPQTQNLQKKNRVDLKLQEQWLLSYFIKCHWQLLGSDIKGLTLFTREGYSEIGGLFWRL